MVDFQRARVFSGSMGKFWDRVWKEVKYQWKPFDGTIGVGDFDEEREPPGYWRKGMFLKDWHFWVGSAALILFFRLVA